MSVLVGQSKAPVTIEIGGQRLRLNANADAARIEQLARLVNERCQIIQRDTRTSVPGTVLALVTLQLMDELDEVRRRSETACEESRRAAATAEARARDVEQAARRAVVDAIAEIDRTLAADQAEAANDSETA